MDPETNSVQEENRGIYEEAKHPHFYTILRHESQEIFALPVNPNSMLFKESTLNFRCFQALYKDPLKQKPSKEFIYNLIVFYIYLTISAVILLGSILIFYNQGGISQSAFTFHLIFILAILTLAYVFLYLIHSNTYAFYKNRTLFLLIGICWYSYLILGNQNLLSKELDLPTTANRLPFSVAMVGFMYYYRLIIFDSYRHTIFILFFALVLNIFLTMAISPVDVTEKLCEYFMVSLVLILQTIDSYKVSMNLANIFYRLNNEEEKTQGINEREQNGNSKNVAEFRSEAELVVEKCDYVIKEIENTKKVIIFKEIKERLKNSIKSLKGIRKFLGRSEGRDNININNHSSIDEDDKEFIAQNFLNLTQFAPDRSATRRVTLKSLLTRRIRFSLSHQSLVDSFSQLESLGQDWNFDVFSLHEKAGSTASIIGKHLFHKWEISEMLGVSQDTYYRLFENIELVSAMQNYHKNPYHNAKHAAEVFHSMYYFILNSGLEAAMKPLESVAAMIAALGHDIGHPGVTNRYLVASKNELALRYNDISVLENMHCAMVYQLLNDPQYNIFHNLKSGEWTKTRRQIIEMILHTDMSKHFEILGRFRTRAHSLKDYDEEMAEDRTALLCLTLKCADLGNSCKTFSLHQKWTGLITEEFFLQGDLEKENRMPVSMYCDRETTDIPKSQAGFLKNVCLPLIGAFVLYLRSEKVEKECLRQLEQNLSAWEDRSKARSSIVHLSAEKEEFLTKVKRIKPV